MTRNVYLGADVNRQVLAALAAHASGGTPQDVVVALANATHVTRAIVDRTNFWVRGRLLAEEIARTEPDLVGLQEVALWRSGPLELTDVGVPRAETVDYDYLEILLGALRAHGADYVPADVAWRADVEAPSFTGSPFDGTMGGNPRDVRMTLRDVILVRRGSRGHDVEVVGSGGGIYAHNLEIAIAGQTLSLDRGYQWVDVVSGDERFRFVNTHLEAFSSELALAQAHELLSVAAPADQTVVLVGDCNSGPLDHVVTPTDEVPSRAPYDLITGTGGFTDGWSRWAPAEDGWTSGLSETVDDASADGFDHRIDMVFVRPRNGSDVTVCQGVVTGTDVADRDAGTGLWPSDHGGVVLDLRLGHPS